MAPESKAIASGLIPDRPKLVQFLTMGGIMSSWIFIPLLAKELGIRDVYIGMIVGFYAAAIFISNYLFGMASDAKGRRIFLWIGLVVSIFALLSQVLAYNLWSLILARVFVGFAAGIFPPALIAYVYESKQKLGKFSAFGSLGWGVMTLAAGFIAEIGLVVGFVRGYDWVFVFSAICFVIAFAISLTLPSVESKSIKVPLFPKKIIKKNLHIYLPLLIRHGAASSLWTFWALFLAVDLDAPDWIIGSTMFVNASVQFVIMFFISDKIKTYWLRSVGILCTVVTFLIFAFATHWWIVMVAQGIIGVSWASLYVGSLRDVAAHNKERATASGLINSSTSLASLAGPILATVVIFIANSVGTNGFMSSYRMVILVAAMFQAIAFLTMIVLSPKPKDLSLT